MRRARRIVLLAALLPIGCEAQKPAPPPAPVAAPAPPPAAPPAPVPLTAQEKTEAEALVRNDCMACHTEEMLLQQRLTGKQWEAVVKKMQGWGAQIEPQHTERVVRYLASATSLSTAPFTATSVEAREALATLDPLPDGPFGRGSVANGKELYAAGCAACHGPDGTGTPLGVNIADRTTLWRAPDFAAVLRKGRGRMPAAAQQSDADIASLLAYARTLRP